MRKLIASVISAALVLSAVPSVTAFSAPDTRAYISDTRVTASSDSYAEQVVKIVNSERAKYGLSPVKNLASMNSAANIRAKEIVGKFSHERPDGRRGYSAIDDAGLSWSWVGENIAAGYTSPQDVMNGWMNSEGHRKNILQPNCKYIGVGYYNDNGYIHWVQLFMDSTVEYKEVSSSTPKSASNNTKGDVNGDSAINAVDASIVLTEYADVSSGKGSKLSSSQKSAADMNSSGTVDAVDASLILSIYANNATR